MTRWLATSGLGLFVGLATLGLSAVAVEAQNWPHWRGPKFNGSSDATNLPVKFSPTENVAWSVALPGVSDATPVTWGNFIFVSSTDEQDDSLKAMCFDIRNGNPLWAHEIQRGTRKDTRSTFSAPSPVTDGEVVVFFFGNGELVSYDLQGNQLWRRNIQEQFGDFAFLWTFSTSPLLYDGKLYMQVLQRDTAVEGRGFTDRVNESYLLAMNPRTGDVLFRQVRPSEAVLESREAFSSPIPFEFQGRREILIAGGDDVTGHDPDTGRELWRWGTWNPGRIPHWRLVPSPVAGDGVVLVCAPKGDPLYAVKAGGQGQLTDGDLAWTSDQRRELSSDVPTPAYAEGDFFILNDLRRNLVRVDSATGQIKWSIATPGRAKYEASPLVADGKIYLQNFAGEVVVVNAEDGEILHQVAMAASSADKTRSSIICAQGHLFVRTNDTLYCIGK